MRYEIFMNTFKSIKQVSKTLVIALSILTIGLISLSSCKNKDPISDPELYANWRLDSISQTGGGGTVTKDFFPTDTISFFDGANIVLTFNDEFAVNAQYNGIQGSGIYKLNADNILDIENIQRGDFLGVQSDWFDAMIDGLNEATSYSIVDSKLSIFYQGNNRQLHFTKL